MITEVVAKALIMFFGLMGIAYCIILMDEWLGNKIKKKDQLLLKLCYSSRKSTKNQKIFLKKILRINIMGQN